MATLDLDPIFVKGLRLLHSRSEDSAAKLRSLLDDVIAQRCGQKSSASGDCDSPPGRAKSSSGTGKQEEKRREAEKRTLDKIKQELPEAGSEPKKVKLDPDSEKEDRFTKEKEKDREGEKERRREKEAKEKECQEQERREREKMLAEKMEREREREEEKEMEKRMLESKYDESTDEEGGMDADDFAMNLGINCIVCRGFEVSNGNQMVECQECHSLYHQECHRPPVTEQDVNDPRFVWYCSRCTKSMKKMVAKPTKSKPVVVGNTSKDSNNGSKTSKPDTQTGTLFPFRRLIEPKPSTKDSTSSGSTKPLSGLASLAANLAGKSSDTKPSQSKAESAKPFASLRSDQSKASSQGKSDQTERSSSVSSSKSSKSGSSSSKLSGTSAAESADKRLQMMKKKAAAKLQEKRVHIK